MILRRMIFRRFVCGREGGFANSEEKYDVEELVKVIPLVYLRSKLSV